MAKYEFSALMEEQLRNADWYTKYWPRFKPKKSPTGTSMLGLELPSQ